MSFADETGEKYSDFKKIGTYELDMALMACPVLKK